MDVMEQSKKERLARLSELNKRALGVSSFEAPAAEPVVVRPEEVECSSHIRELLQAIREKKAHVCRSSARRGGSCVTSKTW